MRFMKRPDMVEAVVWVGDPTTIEQDWVKDCLRVGKIAQDKDGKWMVGVLGGECSVNVGDFIVLEKGHMQVMKPGEFFRAYTTYPDSRTCDASRKQFEDEAYIEYITEDTMLRKTNPDAKDLQQSRIMPPEEFVRRKPDGTYATKMLNAAWWAWDRSRATNSAE